MIPSFLFYVFSAGLLGSAIAVMTIRNMVAAVLFLILAFFHAGGLFLLLNAELIAFTLVIVYVGAVAVLFLFVVMMLDFKNKSATDALKKYRPQFLIMSAFLLFESVLIGVSYQDHAGAVDTVTTTATSLSHTNAHQIGSLLYTNYMLAFQIAGIVLLVAMIGAIVLCFEKRNKVRRQDISVQIRRKDTVRLAKPAIGGGVEYS